MSDTPITLKALLRKLGTTKEELTTNEELTVIDSDCNKVEDWCQFAGSDNGCTNPNCKYSQGNFRFLYKDKIVAFMRKDGKGHWKIFEKLRQIAPPPPPPPSSNLLGGCGQYNAVANDSSSTTATVASKTKVSELQNKHTEYKAQNYNDKVIGHRGFTGGGLNSPSSEVSSGDNGLNPPAPVVPIKNKKDRSAIPCNKCKTIEEAKKVKCGFNHSNLPKSSSENITGGGGHPLATSSSSSLPIAADDGNISGSEDPDLLDDQDTDIPNYDFDDTKEAILDGVKILNFTDFMLWFFGYGIINYENTDQFQCFYSKLTSEERHYLLWEFRICFNNFNTELRPFKDTPVGFYDTILACTLAFNMVLDPDETRPTNVVRNEALSTSKIEINASKVEEIKDFVKENVGTISVPKQCDNFHRSTNHEEEPNIVERDFNDTNKWFPKSENCPSCGGYVCRMNCIHCLEKFKTNNKKMEEDDYEYFSDDFCEESKDCVCCRGAKYNCDCVNKKSHQTCTECLKK